MGERKQMSEEIIKVLEQIKTEISKKHFSIMEHNDFDNGRTYAYDEVIEIIDKYVESASK